MSDQARTSSLLFLSLFFALTLGLPTDALSQKEKEGKKEGNAQQSSSDLDVSQAELENLVKIDQQLRQIRISTQKELKKNIEESKLGEQRYSEIRRAQRTGDNPDMTEKEKKQMEKLQKANKKTRKQMKKKMKKKVKDEGMEFQRYKKLRKAVRRQPELRGRYRKVMKAQQQKKRGKGAPEKKEEGGR